MYRTSYNPYNQNTMYRSSTTTTTANQGGYYDERGFWVPFVVGGLAGGALGYSIANNNFLSNNNNNNGYYPMGPGPRPCCGQGPIFVTPYPWY